MTEKKKQIPDLFKEAAYILKKISSYIWDFTGHH